MHARNARQSPAPADPDALAAAVLDLGPAGLADLLGQLSDAPEVSAAGYLVRPRRPRGERFAERNAHIRADHERGLTPGQIARKEGMSRDAVRQVLRRGRRSGYAPILYPFTNAERLQ